MRFLDIRYIFIKIRECLFEGRCGASGGFSDWFREHILPYLEIIGIILFLLSLIIIIYSLIRLYDIRKDQNKKYAFIQPTKGDPQRNKRWEEIKELVASEEPSNWRQAIIEADIILDDLVTKMGYDGDTLGDKLKNVEKADFQTLDDAWEAHKVRNKIAHEGSDFVLTQREAQRIIGLYGNVFREFGYLPNE